LRGVGFALAGAAFGKVAVFTPRAEKSTFSS